MRKDDVIRFESRWNGTAQTEYGRRIVSGDKLDGFVAGGSVEVAAEGSGVADVVDELWGFWSWLWVWGGGESLVGCVVVGG